MKERALFCQISLGAVSDYRTLISFGLFLAIVCIGVSTPPQKHHPSLSCQTLLKFANCPSPTFLGNPPLYIGFLLPPPPKNQIFQWTSQILKFFIINPILLLKLTKFLVKISQFKVLFMIEKNNFVYWHFLSLSISDFSLYFSIKLQPHPPQKGHPPFSCQPPSKN